MIYEIKRGNTVIWSGKSVGRQYRRIMQEDRVEVSINTPFAIKFKKGDTLVAYGQTYKLNRPENISKKNTQIGYTYDIEFEALYYDFGKWILYTLDKNNALKEPAVYLMGDAKAILGLAIQNANRASSGWTLGVIDDTEVFQWAYSGAKLLTVIQDVADQTNLEFWFDNGGKRLNLTRRQPVTGIELAYGKDNGLYELYRFRRDNPVVTHLTILGGSQNIPNNYGFRNIQPTGGNPMVNPNYVAGMDRVEDTAVFENIYPRLIAKVTATSAPNVIQSTDIDFDLNDHLLNDGTSAQIAFTSGVLNGFKFTIRENGYDHATRQVTFNIIQDDKAYPGGVPDAMLKPAVGDSFVFLNIDMPSTYVTNSEARVKETGDQYFAEEGVEQFDWSAKITPKFALENNTELVLGGLVKLKADDIGFDGNIRIDSFSRDLQESYRYDFTLSNIISINSLVRQRNQSDRLANTVSKGISSDGLSTKATYAERAGYAGTAGHAATATNAATANFAAQAHNSDLWNQLAQPDYVDQPVRTHDDVKHNSLTSPSFASGFAGHGFSIAKNANGDYVAEVDRLFVRKDFNAYELIVQELKSTNGAVIVSDGIKITEALQSGVHYACGIDTDNDTISVPFRIDDIVRCQIFNGQNMKYYVAQVISVTASVFTILILDGDGIPAEGDEIVRIDNFTDANRKGIVYITASDGGAPYVDTVYGMWTNPSNRVRVRMGNLSGIVSPIFGALSGFGFYGKNAYLENVRIHGELIATAGSNVYTQDETDDKIDGIHIGGRNLLKNTSDFKTLDYWASNDVFGFGRNYYSNSITELVSLYGSTEIFKNTNDYPNGFAVTGRNPHQWPNGGSVIRMSKTITGIGHWTVSGYFRSTQNQAIPIKIDISNNTPSDLFYSNSDNSWTYFEYTDYVSNYTDDVYNFVDITDLQWNYYQFKDIKVEKGQNATPWIPAREDGGNLEIGGEFDVHVPSTISIVTQLPQGIHYTEPVKLKCNTTYVYSSYLYMDNGMQGNDSVPLFFFLGSTPGDNDLTPTFISSQSNIGVHSWTKCWTIFTTDGQDGEYCYMHPFIYGGGIGTGRLFASEMMLTEGNKVLPYQPAPEDTDTKIINQVKIAAGQVEKEIDLRAFAGDLSYPLTIKQPDTNTSTRIRVTRPLGSDWGVPYYSGHGAGFSLDITWVTNGSGWGANQVLRYVERNAQAFITDTRGWGRIEQNTYGSEEIIYLRGGSKYKVTVEGIVDPNAIQIHISGYDWGAPPYDVHRAIEYYASIPFPEITYQTKETIQAGITVKPNAVSVFGQDIALTGNVTIKSLSGDGPDALLTVHGLIRADRIDVDELFAQNVTATNLTVTGSSKIGGMSISGGYLTNDYGEGGISISSGTLNNGMQAAIGTNATTGIIPATWGQRVPAYFGKTESAAGDNIALMLNAQNAIFGKNIAIQVQNGVASLKGLEVGVLSSGSTSVSVDRDTVFVIVWGTHSVNPTVYLPPIEGNSIVYVRNVTNRVVTVTRYSGESDVFRNESNVVQWSINMSQNKTLMFIAEKATRTYWLLQIT